MNDDKGGDVPDIPLLYVPVLMVAFLVLVVIGWATGSVRVTGLGTGCALAFVLLLVTYHYERWYMGRRNG